MRRIALFVIFSILYAASSQAVVISRLYDFQPDTPAEAEKVNAEFDNIISAVNGNLSSNNIVAGGIATANIATAAVTQVKLGAKGQQVSSSSGIAQRSSTTEGLVPNLVANITVVSRPVWVGLQGAGDGPGRVSYRHNGGGATDNSAFINFQRDVATANQAAIGARSVTGSTDDILQQLPCSAFWFVDVTSPGPHNYAVTSRIATSDNGIVTVENCKLVVFEL